MTSSSDKPDAIPLSRAPFDSLCLYFRSQIALSGFPVLNGRELPTGRPVSFLHTTQGYIKSMQTIELSISGMMCGACVEHVSKGLQGVSGVQNVAVDLASARAVVSGESLDVSQLAAAVEEEGYRASPVGEGQAQ